jgi:hypothetical protein
VRITFVSTSFLDWAVAAVGVLGPVAFVVWMVVRYARQARATELPVVDGVVSLRCGGRIGSWTMTYPFVRIAVDQHAVQVRYMGSEFALAYRDIERVETLSLFGRVLHIAHRRSDVPRRVLLGTPFAPKLEEFIKERMGEATSAAER